MITIKRESDIHKMREAGRIVATVHEELRNLTRPGVTTSELNEAADRLIRKMGGKPSFLGYGGYPASICTSVNEEVVHGIPGSRVLEDGDIISFDVGAIWQGWQGDAARTWVVGIARPEDEALITATREAFYRGMEQAQEGHHLSDVSHAIQAYAEGFGYGVVRSLVGHGIGTEMHEDPEVPNFGKPGRGPVLKVGMTIAVEPMINAGTHRVLTLEDDWTVVTADGKRSAHYEETIWISENGPVVLTAL